MKVLPDLNDEERAYLRERTAGMSVYESFCRAHPRLVKEKSVQQLGGMSIQYERNNPRIQVWIQYLSTASTEEIIENMYVRQLAFGTDAEAIRAAKAYLESQFAGAEVAEVFLKTLVRIGAEIVIQCQGREESVQLG